MSKAAAALDRLSLSPSTLRVHSSNYLFKCPHIWTHAPRRIIDHYNYTLFLYTVFLAVQGLSANRGKSRVHLKFFRPIFPHIFLCLNTFWSYVTSRYSFASLTWYLGRRRAAKVAWFLPTWCWEMSQESSVGVSSAQRLWPVTVWVSFGAFYKLKVGLHECEDRRPSGHHQ